jgi:DNA phosphorothioation-associated putative methyltransferase
VGRLCSKSATGLSRVGGPFRSSSVSFFSSYSNPFRLADDLLFRAGGAEAVDDACRRSAVGKLLPNALYVHRTALEALDPLLRVYEGCARADLGTLDGANLTKLHRRWG